MIQPFTLDTTLGEIIQEMVREGHAFSLQQVRAGEEEYAVLLANGPGPSAFLQKLMQRLGETLGAESERIEFRVESN